MTGLILGIETSCDETAAAIVENGRHIRASAVASQLELHKKYGGVVPELASRRHVETLLPVLDEAFDGAGVTPAEIDAVAVTQGPGLVGALLVGVTAAKALAFAWSKPLVAVNHLAGHLYANFLGEHQPEFPAVCLIASGGHSDLLLVEGHLKGRLLGRTRDDAAGEAFDKVARLLGLGYPGGPAIDRLARDGDPGAISFPRALQGEETYDFSFSGLKTAVMVYLRQQEQAGRPVNLADVAASFQQAVVDSLVERTIRAARAHGVRQVLLAGGVAANSVLRREMTEACRAADLRLAIPPVELCTDNAAMIAAAGYHLFRQGLRAGWEVDVAPQLAEVFPRHDE